MRIRKVKKEDAKKMSYLKRKTFEKINSKDYPKEVIRIYSQRQTSSKMVEHIKKGEVFLLEDKEKLLGMIDLYNKNMVGSLFVKWNCEIGKGYGKKLLSFVEFRAIKKGRDKLIL